MANLFLVALLTRDFHHVMEALNSQTTYQITQAQRDTFSATNIVARVIVSFHLIFSIFSGQYNVYLQPITEESYLPANANYDPNDEILFPSADLFNDAGRLCEKGKPKNLNIFLLEINVGSDGI